MSTQPFQPRILRANEAPKYLGMCRAEFKSTVRPHVREFPIGKQGIGFDRLELDEWADAYIAAHSIDKHGPQDKRSPQKHDSLVPMTAAHTEPHATAIDPHAKTKDEFQKALAMVKGKPRR
jgi:predicted DNA-binding transcriptional regulator AlpA